VLSSQANPSNIAGITFHLAGLTFTKPVAINNHVELVQITGGSLDVSTDASKVPFTSQLIKAAFPTGLPASSKSALHIDLAQQVAKNGRPIQVAAQKVGGKWYPSLFYTVAAAATDAQPVPQSDYIPAAGAASPQDAVSGAIRALISGNYRAAIALTSPDELGVLHDYGGLILAQAPKPPSSVSFSIKDLQFTTKTLPSGVVRVSLSSLAVSFTAGGQAQEVTVKISGNCIDVGVAGHTQHVCSSDVIDDALQAVGGFGLTISPTAPQRQAIEDLFSGLLNVAGVDTSKIGGQWYVDPVQSYLAETSSILSALKGNDIFELVGFVRSLGQ
jgi:hypothetical protein